VLDLLSHMEGADIDPLEAETPPEPDAADGAKDAEAPDADPGAEDADTEEEAT
jgi:hypothetical protein